MATNLGSDWCCDAGISLASFPFAKIKFPCRIVSFSPSQIVVDVEFAKIPKVYFDSWPRLTVPRQRAIDEGDIIEVLFHVAFVESPALIRAYVSLIEINVPGHGLKCTTFVTFSVISRRF